MGWLGHCLVYVLGMGTVFYICLWSSICVLDSFGLSLSRPGLFTCHLGLTFSWGPNFMGQEQEVFPDPAHIPVWVGLRFCHFNYWTWKLGFFSFIVLRELKGTTRPMSCTRLGIRGGSCLLGTQPRFSWKPGSRPGYVVVRFWLRYSAHCEFGLCAL